VTALNLVEQMVDSFPGLVNGEDEVDAGDLVDLVSSCLRANREAESAIPIRAGTAESSACAG
jgi:hypothetical protein